MRRTGWTLRDLQADPKLYSTGGSLFPQRNFSFAEGLSADWMGFLSRIITFFFFLSIMGNAHGPGPGPSGCSLVFLRKGSRASWSPQCVLCGSGCVGETKFGSRWRVRQKMPSNVLSIRGSSEDSGI